MQRIMAKGSKDGGSKGMLMWWVVCLWCLSNITLSTAFPVPLPTPRTEGIAPEQALAALEDGSVAENTTVEWLEVCTDACAVHDHARAAAQSQEGLQAQQSGNATTSHTYVFFNVS